MKTVGLMGGRGAGEWDGHGGGAFCRGLPFGIRRFKPILPFLGGRSDAACRVVMKTVGLMGGRREGAWDGHGGAGGRGLRNAKIPPGKTMSALPRPFAAISHMAPAASVATWRAALRLNFEVTEHFLTLQPW